ncbi:MAG TPA: SDR family NAD(P)-dependent oxidoreductase, partial [Armatimonadetes bacterium]|nr:SDR family NAD(P)-dependent oxidoreductase [Armatimonadota bacterium]
MQPLTLSLHGKVAWVTGGSRGIGRAIVLRLAAQGADVAFTYRQNIEAARQVVESVEAMGRRILPLQADVADRRQVDRTINEILNTFG